MKTLNIPVASKKVLRKSICIRKVSSTAILGQNEILIHVANLNHRTMKLNISFERYSRNENYKITKLQSLDAKSLYFYG